MANQGDGLKTTQPAGDGLSIEAIKAAVKEAALPEQAVREGYAARLLAHAVETRDAEAGGLVARLMDDDPALDAALEPLLYQAVAEQPGAVYAFIRAHVAEKPNPHWLERLRIAALYSLRVAINDAEAETIANWLTLIAREPASYGLGDVLHYGILAAQERARREPELARQLVLVAAKRDPAALEILLADDELLVALPDNIGKSVRDLDGDPLLLLQNRGPEIFMVAMGRAAAAQVGAMFVPVVIPHIWELYSTDTVVGSLPAQYQPEAVVQSWMTNGVRYLKGEALVTLLALVLANRRDDLLTQLLRQPDGAKTVVPLLVVALENSQRTVNEALDLIGRLVAGGDITPQQAVELYTSMAAGLSWGKEALPLLQQVARSLQQHPALQLPPDVLWNLLNFSSEVRDELIARVVVKRLLAELESQEDDAPLIDALKRLVGQVAWSETARATITNWWRGFVRQQSIGRLHRLDKALDGKRSLEAERNVLLTLTAVRKMLGNKTLLTFADEIHAAHTALEALSASFDPTAKRQLTLDQATLRAELDGREDQLSTQERQILANNLKELAQVIAAMGDNRTRASVLRRGEDLDRDLMSGDQAAHSAIDAMKWLSGYWGETTDEE